MKRAAVFACGFLVAGCFPSLDDYAACADGGCGGATGTPSATAVTGATGTGQSAGNGTGSSASSGSGSSSGTGGATTSSSSSGSGGGGGGAGPTCDAPAGGDAVQDGVRVEGEALGSPYGFCIDRAEVTHQSYRAFWRAIDQGTFDPAPVLAARAECSFKASDAEAFVPAFGDLLPSDWDNTTNPLLPIVSVDWCDAYAYCAWAGKRLCGGIEGSTIAYEEEQPRNEWYLACSNGDQRSFCYAADGDNEPNGCVNGAGNEASCPAYDPDACKSAGDCNGWRGLWEASEAGTCAAADPSLVNLSGNVAEWIDACEEVAGQPGVYRCEARGGSCPLGTYTSCHWTGGDGPATVEDAANYTGFRCCWDGE